MAHLPAAEPLRAVDGWTRSWRKFPLPHTAASFLPSAANTHAAHANCAHEYPSLLHPLRSLFPSWRFSSSGAAAAAPGSAALHFWEGFRLAGELCGPNLAGLVSRQEARAASGWFESRGAQIGWVRGQARFSR
jgi:hypothetical protein